MADLDIEVEAAIFGEFTGLAARCEHERQRNAEDAPATQHHLQPAAVDHQRHRDGERPKALADKPLVAAAALLQHAGECATSDAAPPMPASTPHADADFDRDILACGREAHHAGGEA